MTTVTDKVKLDDDRVGIVKFVGEIHNKGGFFYGVEVTKGAGLNSGNVGGDIYFPCKRNKGVFVKDNKIARSKPVDEDFPRITYGTRVDIPDKGLGTVKYVGYPEFRRGEQLFVGIELEAPNGKNNGTVNGKFYFRTADGHGVFLPRAKLDQCAILDDATEAADEEAKDEDEAEAADAPQDNAATDDPEPATDDPDPQSQEDAEEPQAERAEDDEEAKIPEVVYEVGDGVLVDGDKRGLVRFAGENRDTAKLGVGLWYGVRLVQNRGNCDGTYKGVKFFKCPPGFGAMVQAKRITRKLTEEEMDFDFAGDDEPTEEELARHAALEAAREKKKQIRAFRAKFKEIDEDNNMTIELDEFQTMMAESTGASPEDAERLFYEIDVSRSGAISFAEFDGWFQKQTGTSNLGGDEEKTDDATAAMSQALVEDIQEDVAEDVAEEMAAEDAAADAGDEAGDEAGDADEAQQEQADEDAGDE